MIILALLLVFVGPGTAASAERKGQDIEKPPLASILGRSWADYLIDVSKDLTVAQRRAGGSTGDEDFIMAAKPGTPYTTYFQVYVSNGKIYGLEVWENAPRYEGVFRHFRIGAKMNQLEKEYGPAPYKSRPGREGQSSSGWVVGDYLIIVSGAASRIFAYKKDFLPSNYRKRLGSGFSLQDLADGKTFDGQNKKLPANHSVERPAAR